DLERSLGDTGDVAGDLLEGAIADDIVGADAEDLPLAEATEDTQDGGVLERGVHFRLELGPQLLGTGTAPQRHAEHVDVIGIGDEEVAERLAGAEQLQKDLEGAGAALQKVGNAVAGRRVGQEALKVVERHIRIGAARQEASEWSAQFTEGIGRQTV